MHRAQRRGRRYLKVLSWLLADSFGQLPRQSLRVSLYAGVRLACQAGAVAILYAYAGALEQDQTVGWLSLDFAARGSRALLWMVIASSGGLFLAAAGLDYLSRAEAIHLSGAYEERCARRAMSVRSRLPDLRVPEANELLVKSRSRQVAMDGRRCGMAVRSLGYVIPAIITGVASVMVVLYLDPLLTLSLGVLAALAFAGQYPANVKAAKLSSKLESAQRMAGQEITSLMAQLGRETHGVPPDSRSFSKLYDSGSVGESLAAFSGRLRAVEEGTLVFQAGGTVVVGVAVFVIGNELVSGGSDWGRLLVYVVALRAVVAGVVKVGRTLTTLSRFYPKLIRSHILAETERALEAPVVPFGAEEELLIDARNLSGVQEPLRMRPGDRIACFSPGGVGRHLLHTFSNVQIRNLNRVRGRVPRLAAPTVASSALESGKESVRQTFGFPAGYPTTEATRCLSELSLDFDRREPLDLDSAAPGILGDDPQPGHFISLSICAGLSRGSEIFFIDHDDFSTLTADQRSHVLRRLERTIVLFVYRNLVRFVEERESLAVVVDDSSLVGWMPIRDETEIPRIRETLATLRLRVPAEEKAAEFEALDELDDDANEES